MIGDENSDTVLVTGGSGLVGKAVSEEVEKNKHIRDRFKFIYLSSKDADLTDQEQALIVFEKYKPSYVINLAAKVGGLYANMNDNESFYGKNMAINMNVLSLSSRFKVKKCISCLSTCIFPANIELPLDETKIHSGDPHESNSGYSLAKRQVDLLNKRYNSLEKDSLFTAIVPTNTYGKYDNFDLKDSHVVPGLIHKGYLAATEAKANKSDKARLIVCGSGKPMRQFIYSLDLARLILWALENYTDTEPLILCDDETIEFSISNIANTITDIFAEKFDIEMVAEFDALRSDGQHKKTASNSKLRSLNQGFNFTPFRIGIQETIDWFCLNYPKVRK